MSQLEQLYQATILAHDRAPHHAGRVDAPTHAARLDNPLCGDEIDLTVRIDAGQICDIRFEGRGCALSRAAASLMTCAVTARSPADAVALADAFERFVREPVDAPTPDGLGELTAFAGVRRFRARAGCATLAFRALRAALASEA